MSKVLIDQIREVFEENDVMTFHALQRALLHGEDEKIETIRCHLLTLLELDEIFIVHNVTDHVRAAYVWKVEEQNND